MHSMAEGFAVRRIPIGMHQGESAQALCDTLGGKPRRACTNSPKISENHNCLPRNPSVRPFGPASSPFRGAKGKYVFWTRKRLK